MGQRQSEIIKNHMEVYWHDYASASKGVPITEGGACGKPLRKSHLDAPGLMLLEGWHRPPPRRNSMNRLAAGQKSQQQRICGLHLSIKFTKRLVTSVMQIALSGEMRA